MRTVRLQRRFIALFAGIFIAIALIMVFAIYFVVDALIKNTVHESVDSRQTEMDNGVHLIFNEINIAHARIVYHEDFSEFVSERTSESEKRKLYEKIVSDVGLADIFTDAVVVTDGKIYSRYDGVSFPESFLREIGTADNLVTQSDVMHVGGATCLPVGKRLILYPLSETVGYTIFLVDCTALGERIASLKDLGYSMIVRSDGYVIADDLSRFAGSRILEAQGVNRFDVSDYRVGTYGGKRSIMVVNPMQTVNADYRLKWSVVSVLDYDVLFASVKNLNVYILLIGVAALAGGIVFAWFSARRLSRPISEFSGRIRSLDKAAGSSGIEEFDLLYGAYREMLDRIDELLLTTRRDDEVKRKLELESLQMQINPHFLYNTLDAISWMAKINRQPEIEHMVLSLAALFRASLHNGDKFITVREEMDLVQNFVQIQKVRFPERFVFEEDFDGEVANKYTLKLLLQPIVENCVKHGIVGLKRVCRIKVSARLDGGDIVYEIGDDGVGFDPAAARASGGGRSGGYGLKNVDERVRLEYGEEYGLHTESAPGKGTRVVIRIKASDSPEL